MKTNVSFDNMQTLAELLNTGVDERDSVINGHIDELTKSLADLAVIGIYECADETRQLLREVSDSIASTLIELREIQAEYLRLAKG